MSKKEKQIRKSGWLLLAMYFFLLGLNTLHYHQYNIDSEKLIKQGPSHSQQANDIIQDFSGSCFIHHFANTVLDNSFSSSAIIKTKPLNTDYFHPRDVFIPSLVQYASSGLRAPPAFI